MTTPAKPGSVSLKACHHPPPPFPHPLPPLVAFPDQPWLWIAPSSNCHPIARSLTKKVAQKSDGSHPDQRSLFLKASAWLLDPTSHLPSLHNASIRQHPSNHSPLLLRRFGLFSERGCKPARDGGDKQLPNGHLSRVLESVQAVVASVVSRHLRHPRTPPNAVLLGSQRSYCLF